MLFRSANSLGQVQEVARQLALASGRNWQAAADRLLDRVTSCVRDLPYYVHEVENTVESSRTSMPTLRDILAELRQVQEEFGDLQYSPQGQYVSVTTEPIELENVFLGEFEIRVNLTKLCDSRRRDAYRVIALDPHPAASNDSVPHPHVSDEHLCEGEASAAIGAALASGRLGDFFLLVRSVLTTYNSGSPYVPLEDWNGVSCYECGGTTNPDDSYRCHQCEREFCSECISFCRRCDESACAECLTSCPICGERTCESCMTRCGDCGEPLCRTCEEDGRCQCDQTQKGDEDEPEPDSTTQRAGQRAG